MNRFLVILLLCLWVEPAPAQEQSNARVTFYVDPPSEISIDVLKAQSLGLSGRPVALSVRQEQLHSPVMLRMSARVPFSDRVIQDEELISLNKIVTDGRWPDQGYHRLDMEAGDRFRFWVAKNWPWLGVVFLLALGLGFGILLPRRREHQRKMERARRLEELVPTEPGADPLLGTRFGDFRLVSELGKGGMATVYRALPEATLSESEAVAVKVMNTGLQDETFKARFRREIRVLAEMNHPNIVKVLDFGEENERLFLVMEQVVGTDLREAFQGKPVPPKQVQDLIRPIAGALEHAHEKGVVHRDLKPENVMLTPTRSGQRVLVMDFGLARRSNFDTVTQTGNILGTPHYMAPEQFEGAIEAPSDQYAFAIMVFEMLAGRLPFEAPDMMQLIVAHLQKEPPLISSIRPELAPLDPVLNRMLCKSPADRYPDIRIASQELLKALERVSTPVASKAESETSQSESERG